MMDSPLFRGQVLNGATKYVGLEIVDGRVGCHIIWTDATSAATITLELTSLDDIDAPTTTAGTYQWKDSAVTIVGPTGAGASSSLVNVENVNQKRARLKIVATANCNFIVLAGINYR
jgi:hypothetical protein